MDDVSTREGALQRAIALHELISSDDEGLAISQACLTLAGASRDAVVFAFDHAGASVIYAHQPLQRRLRDIFTGLKHASFTPALLSLVGKQQLGVRISRKPI